MIMLLSPPVRDSLGKYKCTLVDGGEGRYLAMSTAPGIIVTGGHKLRAWIHLLGRYDTNGDVVSLWVLNIWLLMGVTVLYFPITFHIFL